MSSESASEHEYPPLKSLTPIQRRIIGVLIEKGFTTPEAYPLTPKALTSGCNQKNNRYPLTNYEEYDLEEPINKLRELGLAAVVHTETGRTERYRHYMRRRFTISDPQLAILGELLLRGRQSVGELRGRASRMAPIDTLEQLRDELNVLIGLGLVQSDGSLERRGAEVDHALYEPREQSRMAASPSFTEPKAEPAGLPVASVPSGSPVAAPQHVTSRSVETKTLEPVSGSQIERLERTCTELRNDQQEVQAELSTLRAEVARLANLVEQLRSDLGA